MCCALRFHILHMVQSRHSNATLCGKPISNGLDQILSQCFPTREGKIELLISPASDLARGHQHEVAWMGILGVLSFTDLKVGWSDTAGSLSVVREHDKLRDANRGHLFVFSGSVRLKFGHLPTHTELTLLRDVEGVFINSMTQLTQ